MKNLRELERWRRPGEFRLIDGSIASTAIAGLFVLHSPTDGRELLVVATIDDGWEHVSVSRKNRVPNWHEMDYVKREFFRDDETAMQLHVPPAEHVDCHPYCLHLWRPVDQPIPRPRSIHV